MRIGLLLLVGASLLVGGCSAGPAEQPAAIRPGEVAVRLTDTRFEPPRLEIRAGETVAWVNASPVLHSVTEGSPGGGTHLFRSPDFGRGGSYRYTFRKPGTYEVFCRTANHHLLGMTMQVVVAP